MITRRAALAGGGAALAVGLLASRAGALEVPTSPREIEAGWQRQGGWVRGNVLPGAMSLKLDDRPVPFDHEGRFFLGFDRDCGPSAKLTILHDTGEHYVALDIAPGAWEIEQVDAPFHPPAMPDETFAALRKGELAQIEAARAKSTGAQGWRQQFTWPVKGRISGRFGAQRVYRGTPGSYHPGLDIATGETGTPYASPADGVVVLAAGPSTGGPFTLEGNLLMIDHGMGLSSAFLHSSALLVGEGDRIAQGQPIGHIGMTGRATGPHLHWGLRWREARLDPLLMLGSSAASA